MHRVVTLLVALALTGSPIEAMEMPNEAMPTLTGAPQLPEVPPAPVTQFDHQTHDFQTIPRDKVQHCTFTVTNTGTAPLVIHHVATGCGCTTTQYTKTPIPPGGKGKVEVDFNPATQRPGNFRKSITVYVNTIHAYTRLFVKGVIEESNQTT